jgi:deazaflavin-dependent oxidoreductase (nitroreductase family)
MRRIATTVLVLLGVLVVFWTVETALMVWAWRSRNARALRLIKRFNKYVTNPMMLRFSGRSGPSAVVHHVGRRSGRPYATPVIAHHAHEDVIIPLPYGTEVDWLRNVLVAGRGVVDLDGRSLMVDEPAVVGINDVIDVLPAPMVRTIRFNGAHEALRMRVSEPTPASAGGQGTKPKRR